MRSLRFATISSPELKGRTISDAHHVVSLTDVLSQTVLGGRLRELAGRSVLLKLSDQLRSGLAMIELDGVARRMLLCPPDLNPAHLDALIADAEIDAVVTDEPDRWAAEASRSSSPRNCRFRPPRRPGPNAPRNG